MSRPPLTLVPDKAELRRRWDLRAARLQLPPDIGSHRITWQPWQPSLRISHYDPRCDHCQADDMGTARGLTARPPRRRKPRPLLVRFYANGCPDCGAVTVMDLYPDPASLQFTPVDVWTNRGQQELW